VAALLGVALLLAACSGGDDSADETGTDVTQDATEDGATGTDDADLAGDDGDALGFDSELTVVVANTAGTLTTSGQQRRGNAALLTESGQRACGAGHHHGKVAIEAHLIAAVAGKIGIVSPGGALLGGVQG